MTRQLALFLFACGLAAGPAASQRITEVPELTYLPEPFEIEARRDTLGLAIRLLPSGAGPAPRRPAMVRALDPVAADALRARLPALAVAATADIFAFPEETLPAPRAGRRVGFVTTVRQRRRSGAPPAATGLAVTRRVPVGEAPLGSAVVVGFSRPMVPLSEARQPRVPIRLTPEVPGTWRWLDPRTARFEPAGQLPMATEFTVEVPAGTRAQDGTVLDEAVRWTFGTRAARAIGALPHRGPAEHKPFIVAVFDGRVDPAAVLATTTVAVGGRAVPIRLATAPELQALARGEFRLRNRPRDRWVVVRPVERLPGDTVVEVRIGPGTPSREGGRRTGDVQRWTFRTHGPLRITGQRCGWNEGEERCEPDMPLVLTLSNPAGYRDRTRHVQVEPAIEGMQVAVWRNQIYIHGRTRPETSYRVRIDSLLRDEFGQRLGESPPRTFRVGRFVAGIRSPYQDVVVLDPLGPQAVSVFAHDHARLRVRVNRVEPRHWEGLSRLRAWRGRGEPVVLPGTQAIDRVHELRTPPGEAREVLIDLAPVLRGGPGQLLVAVEALEGDSAERRQAVYLWVQSTRLALLAAAEADSLTVSVGSLVDGRPVPGARLSLTGGASRRTDRDGIATLPLRQGGPTPLLVARSGSDVALLGPGMVAAPGPWDHPDVPADWLRHPRPRTRLWYHLTDRYLYRPGETVRFKGWVRARTGNERSVLVAAAAPGDSVRYRVLDARDVEVGRGSLALGPRGGFDGAVAIPEGANLGDARIEFRLDQPEAPDPENELYFSIDHFRRPEYTVSLTAEPGPHLVGGSAELTALAAHFSGGGLPGASVKWMVRASPADFTPPGWEAWRFGTGRPGWMAWAIRNDQTHAELSGETDGSGGARARVHFDTARPATAHTVDVRATVTDVNRQVWNTGTALLVHPATVYPGVRTGRDWLQAGDTLELDLMVVNLDGAPVPGRPIEVEARRYQWQTVDGRWDRVQTGRERCERRSGAAPTGCIFPAVGAGEWVVTATTLDEQGRPSRTDAYVWVIGRDARFPPRHSYQQNTVDLIPDGARYDPGDTARVLLRLPFSPSHGVVTVRRHGVRRVESFSAAGPMHTVAIPIAEADGPSVSVTVDAVGGTAGGTGDAPTPRGVDAAAGSADLEVSLASRTLTVRPVPVDSVMAPDADGAVEVEVRDPAGRPVAGAEIALVGADEAVLALAGYPLADPVATFYPEARPGAFQLSLQPLVRVFTPDLTPAPGTLVGRVVHAANGDPVQGVRLWIDGDSASAATDVHGRFRIRAVPTGRVLLHAERSGFQERLDTLLIGPGIPAPLRLVLVPEPRALGRRMLEYSSSSVHALAFEGLVVNAIGTEVTDTAAIGTRRNFDPLAFWVPAGRTGADGRLRAPFSLPSSLTRYLVSAVAADSADRFGMGQSRIVVRKALMARPSAPRFLNLGDRFELPVVVQNGTGDAIEVRVAGRGDGIVFSDSGRVVTVPAFDRAEVRLSARAVRAGPARLQVAIAGGGHTDAAELTVPVYTPAAAESFALHGQLTGGSVVLPIEIPREALPGYGGLEVTTSSTALQELTDAFLYLVRYPYECAEQKASRILAVSAMGDVLARLSVPGMPAESEIRARLREDVAELVAGQNPDGGWSFWHAPGIRSWPIVSIHVAHALQQAAEGGMAVPDSTRERALRYLRSLPDSIPDHYPPEARRALQAHALYVRDRMGDSVGDELRAFVDAHGGRMGVEEAGWLLAAAADDPSLLAARTALLRRIEASAAETPSTATFTGSYEEGAYLLLHSARRTDAVVLQGLLAADPQNELVSKTVRGLLGHRVAGRWLTTQENAWVLLSLERYFRSHEAQMPDFVARVWLGERYAGGAEFRGRSVDRAELSVPMGALRQEAPGTVTIGHQGRGRLYYRAGLRYALNAADAGPLERGFAVERGYEAVDASEDVVRGPDGVVRVRAGARVRVTVTMTAPSRRLHVALVDPLPAGWEAVNGELRGAEPLSIEDQRQIELDRLTWWDRPWFEHQNLRDDRVEAFTTLLPAGVHRYSYIARATTPGTYLVPPPRAEEMYAPESFGRGSTDRVVVQ